MLIDTKHPAGRHLVVCKMGLNPNHITRVLSFVQCVNLDTLAYRQLVVDSDSNVERFRLTTELDRRLESKRLKHLARVDGVADEVLWREGVNTKTVLRLVDQFPALADLRYQAGMRAAEAYRPQARRRVKEQRGEVCRRCTNPSLPNLYHCAIHVPTTGNPPPVLPARNGLYRQIIGDDRGNHVTVYTRRKGGTRLELSAMALSGEYRLIAFQVVPGVYLVNRPGLGYHLREGADTTWTPYEWVSVNSHAPRAKIITSAQRQVEASEAENVAPSLITTTPSIFGL